MGWFPGIQSPMKAFFTLNIEIYLWGGINLNAKFNVEIFWTSVWGTVRGIGFITSSVLSFQQFYNFNFSFEPQWISYNLLSWGLKKTKLNFWSVNLESVLTLWLDFVCLAVQCFILSMLDLPSNSLKLQRHLPKPTRGTPDCLPKEPEDPSGCIGHRIPDFLSHFTAEKTASGCSGNGDLEDSLWSIALQSFRILSWQGVEAKLSFEEPSGAQSFPKICTVLETKAFSMLSPCFPARPNINLHTALAHCCLQNLLLWEVVLGENVRISASLNQWVRYPHHRHPKATWDQN